MRRRLYLDTETYSGIKLSHGVHKYATDGEVMIVTYATNWTPDKTVYKWDVTNKPIYKGVAIEFDPPQGLIEAILLADEIWAAGAEFDRTMLETAAWWRALNVPLERWCCLHALARSVGLPGGLDKLGRIFKLPLAMQKDEAGKGYIQMFCVPQQDGSRNTARSHPEQWAGFLEYAKQDIVVMRELIENQIPFWNWTPFERAVQIQDAIMNARGVRMDVELAAAAVKCTTRAKRRLGAQTEILTAGEVERTTQRDKLLRFILAAYGVDLPDLKMDTVERRLNDPELPEAVKELLRNRQEASKASTAKYQRVLSSAVGDRLYGLLVYCGANRTGRWAGRIFQPHNLPRPKHDLDEINVGIEAFKLDDPELITDDVMGLASSMLRSLPIAADGHKLLWADLKNIEGRDLTWMAGEAWKLSAFAAYDAGVGPDLYILSYANSFRVAVESVNNDQRQVGKVQELALGYYGGVGAFISMSEVYRIDLDAMAEKAYPSLRKQDIAQALVDWHKAVKRRRTFGLEQKTWVVCQVFVLGWRRAHANIMKFHKDIENAVISAIGRPRQVFTVRGFSVDRVGNWLRIKCPSGSYICYPGIRYDADKREISYLGENQYTRQFQRIKTYSGKVSQNLTERVARDTIAAGMLDAEAEGYRPVLTVHDSLMCEPPDDPKYSVAGLIKILTKYRKWSDGLPLAAAGDEGYRYWEDK